MSFLTPGQRAALRRAGGDGPLSRFVSPPTTEAKLRRIRLMALDPDHRIRESAALAVHAPADVLRALTADGAPSVRCCVARNPATPVSSLELLADDEVAQVRGWVAAHPRTTAELSDRLATDPDPQVRRVVEWARGWEPGVRNDPADSALDEAGVGLH
ncbi:hypothetical protein JL108_16145 [Aeromicrobium sp. YIM 150415]|uniref:variant leucine-rich repeat-containing protein n=1 Tax=Aeromicrobium sp. YIM 150415 TaxID=2803912 RepID=UPI0019666666|nr:hypothetical protein [Aeromicrobium sp. YIM 150415]MBM9464984.1 hypothetical protein [Aeromicrobium sp. YIM 150415]